MQKRVNNGLTKKKTGSEIVVCSWPKVCQHSNLLFYIMAQSDNISSVYPIIRGSTLLRCFNAAKIDCWSSIKEKVGKESKLIYIHLS